MNALARRRKDLAENDSQDASAVTPDTKNGIPLRRPVGRPRKHPAATAGSRSRRSGSPSARGSGPSVRSRPRQPVRPAGTADASGRASASAVGAKADKAHLAASIAYGEGSGRGSARLTRKRILAAARLLFARHGMDGVSVRAIAEEAGVNHALVHRYFGNKMDMVSEIVQNEVAAFGKMSVPQATSDFHQDLLTIREIIRHVLTDMKTTVLLVQRAEMDGLSPSRLLQGLTPRGAGNLAEWIESQQAKAIAGANPNCGPLPDPKTTAMVISGAVFELVAAEPWLASAVGLDPDGSEERRERLLDTIVNILAQAAGRPLIE